jgi:hypothetical protein
MKAVLVGLVALTAIASGVSISTAAASSPAASKAEHYHYSTVSVKVRGVVCRKIEMAGVNDHGTLVGTTLCGISKGFVRTIGGRTTKFRVPGPAALRTQTSSISSNGIVSLYAFTKGKQSYTSYLRAPSGRLTALANPLAGPGGTRVLAVNASGEAVGAYYTNTPTSVLAPFILKNGTLKEFNLGIKGATSVILTGVTDRGVISGQFSDRSKTVRGFLYRAGKVELVKVPGAPVLPKRGSGVTNLAASTVLTGNVYRKLDVKGFVGHTGHFTTVSVPGSFSTYCQGVNAHREVVGFYLTTTGLVRGFVARLTSKGR